MILLDGFEVARQRNLVLREKINGQIENGKRAPSLAVILIGNNPASASYVKGKVKACNLVGIKEEIIRFDEDVEKDTLIKAIHKLNADSKIDGIIVQLPIPKHLDSQEIINLIDVSKDVDGFTTLNQGLLFQKRKAIHAATPQGILNLLDHYEINVSGKHVVVVGRSNIVGVPIAKLMLDLNATVTIAHSKTVNLSALTAQADILIAAVGQKQMITKDMVKPNSIIIDVGINRYEGKLFGDVDFEGVKDIVFAITPVPKGVGPMTINALLENTFELYLMTQL